MFGSFHRVYSFKIYYTFGILPVVFTFDSNNIFKPVIRVKFSKNNFTHFI